jgi:hypothetical protein
MDDVYDAFVSTYYKNLSNYLDEEIIIVEKDTINIEILDCIFNTMKFDGIICIFKDLFNNEKKFLDYCKQKI